LQVAVNRKEILKLQGRTRIPVISTGDGQHFKPELIIIIIIIIIIIK